MRINIFDVSHGFCTYVVADNGNVILIDCGHNEKTGFRPSNYLPANGCEGIELLIISNYDEDHLSDLPNLWHSLPIYMLNWNDSIDIDELYRLKLHSGPIQPGMEALLNIMSICTPNIASPPYFPEIELIFFYNRYPEFRDTNNLSLITFLHYHDLHIIFPGDLEKKGWLSLLRKQSFREQLSLVNLFVASHHGRFSGYCPEVFNYCHPELVVISDESIQYETQKTEYGKHASGIWFGHRRRYVVTTRKYGMITINQLPGKRAVVKTAH